MTRILLIEDEAKIAKLVANDLKLEGFVVEIASDGQSGLEKALSERWDVVILDVMLPKMDGLQVCRALRAQGSRVPVLMLTAKSQETDKVVGLQIGADDYLTKPFSVLELVARIKALVRRAGGPQELAEYTKASWRIDFRRQEAWKGKERLTLTTKEFQLLQYLITHRDHVVSREQFLKDLWQFEEELPTTRTVDNQIASLRRKLGWGEESKGPKILTVHNSGYRFVD